MSYIQQYLEAVTKLQRGSLPEHAEKSQHAFILRHGRAMPFGREQFSGPIKMCFQNAAMLASRDSSLTYCEGYTTTCGIPIEHAWCIDQDGKVVETTIRERDETREYFGVPIRTDFMRSTVLKKGTYTVFDWVHPEIWNAVDPETIVKKETTPV